MPAIKSSKPSRISKPKPKRESHGGAAAAVVTLLLLLAYGATAAWFFWSNGYSTYYGDAESHLNIGRRIVDSGQPGYDQIGTVWLPLPHLLIALFARYEPNWTSGLAGVIPGVICYALAGLFLFLAMRRLYGDTSASFSAVAMFALNPNLLYLQSAPMTEPVFFAATCGLLYASVVIRITGSFWAVILASFCTLSASLTRYEGWALIPVVFVYILLASPKRKLLNALLFGLISSLAPVWWLAHNWWYYGDAFYFYYGPDSARGIYQRALNQGMARYPGDHDWPKAIQMVSAAATLAVGPVLLIAGLVGLIAALLKRAFWPALLLSIAPVFYIVSMYGSGTPIFVPTLWPFSYYNTRYGLAALPLAAFGVGSIVALLPHRFKGPATVIAVLGVCLPWLLPPRLDRLICWKESQVNSEARRAWTSETAEYLKIAVRPADRIRIPFGDTTGILRAAGIPLRRTIHEGDSPQWNAGIARPDLFFWEEWVVCVSGDPLCSAALKTLRQGPRYERVKIVSVKGAAPIEIYRRDTEPRLPTPPEEPNENPVHESTRRSK